MIVSWEEVLISEENKLGPKAVSPFDDHVTHLKSHANHLNLNMFLHITNHIGFLMISQVIKPSFSLKKEILVQKVRG